MQASRKKADWRRVNKSCKCPICGHDSWCSIDAADGETVKCMRVGDGGKRCKAGGWIHRLGQSTRERSQPLPRAARNSVIDAEWFSLEFFRELTEGERDRWADRQGVSRASARMFRLGYSRRHKAFAIPMVDGTGEAIGIRLRSETGRKWAMKGSRSGCFRAADQPRWPGRSNVTVIVEGPTDAMAMHSIKMNVIGRPDCTGGGAIARELVERFEYPGNIVIIADNDAPGIDGAKKLRREHFPKATIVTPPDGVKDVREWIASGADESDVRQYLRGAVRL